MPAVESVEIAKKHDVTASHSSRQCAQIAPTVSQIAFSTSSLSAWG